jgi:hypothetical protein
MVPTRLGPGFGWRVSISRETPTDPDIGLRIDAICRES